MATFPDVALLTHDYEINRQPAVRRTDMESGPPKQMKILSRVMVTRKLSYAFESLANYQTFITWFNADINRGASWFDWRDPVDDAIKQARIVAGKLDKEVPNKRMDVWVISFDLETWDA